MEHWVKIPLTQEFTFKVPTAISNAAAPEIMVVMVFPRAIAQG